MNLVVGLLMFDFNLSAGQTPLNKPRNLPLHAEPPITQLHVWIHLRVPWMDRKLGLMILLQDLLLTPPKVGTQILPHRVNNPRLS